MCTYNIMRSMILLCDMSKIFRTRRFPQGNFLVMDVMVFGGS